MNKIVCSIIITNYNLGHYLDDAVNSALAQTYGNVEVIVVDDGSSDGSDTVIRSYGEAITPILKPNGGQASAMNCGFARSRGDIIIFLDADDMLLPNTLERVVNAWTLQTSKTHFRLQQIRTDGTLIANAVLPPYRPLPTGNLRGMVRRFGFYPSSPTSGNAFSRQYLNRIMPIPEEPYRGWADTFLIGPAPLFGEIGAIDGIGGYYRRHDANLSSVNMDRLRVKLRADLAMTQFIASLPSSPSWYGAVRARWPQHLKEQLILQKFGDTKGAERSMLPVALDYLRCVLTWPEYNPSRRIVFAAWAVAMLVLPKSVLLSIRNIVGASIRVDP